MVMQVLNAITFACCAIVLHATGSRSLVVAQAFDGVKSVETNYREFWEFPYARRAGLQDGDDPGRD